MKHWFSISLSLAVLLAAEVLAQKPVEINFSPELVQVQTGTAVLFTVQTESQVFSMSWKYQNGETIALWTETGTSVNNVNQFVGRITISATQLRIGAAQLNDAGFYTVEVVPVSGMNLATASKSVELKVFDPVTGVSLAIPSVAVEDKRVSLNCTWTGGTKVTTQWGKDGGVITPDSRINISDGSLVINPSSRDDAGEYTCTASNNVSAQTSTKSLTVYYGPDTPVVTIDSPKECVGEGDVLVGQTVRFKCTSTSLPPATFSWEHDGHTISSGAQNSGVLNLQTFSTNESGPYVCTATNSLTGDTSTQSYDLAIVDVCFNGGEVAGIVIGSFLGLLIIVLLIWFLVIFVRKRREREQQRNIMFAQKTDPIQRPLPPDPQANWVRNLDQGLQPPLHQTNREASQPERLITNNLESRANQQTLPLDSRRDFDVQQNNSRTHTNPLPQNTAQNVTSYPDNGFNNPTFMPMDSQNVNRPQNVQPQQNPNVLIQTMPGQGGNQPPAVQVCLNALPNSNNPNNNAQMPTINVNLNSYPGNGQQALQESSSPLPNNQAFDGVPQNTRRSNPATQSRHSYPNNHRLNGHVNPVFQEEPGLVPTGYTHFNSHITSQRNENTQTYQEDLEPRRRQERVSRQHDSTPRSRRSHIPQDLLRGTPSYPSGSPQRAQAQPEAAYDSDYSAEYTIHPPIPEGQTLNRMAPQTHTATRRRTPPRRDPPSDDSQTQTYPADDRHLNAINVTLPDHSHHTQRTPRTDRESAQRDIRGSQSALRQETTHSNNPQASPLVSQQASAGQAALSRGTTTQGLATPQRTDTRALADPNHLQQPHMAQQNIAVPAQTRLGHSTHTEPVISGATQPGQGGANPVPVPPSEPNPNNLTQAALKAHTERAQVFQNRREQTQAALIHSGAVQAKTPAARGHQPPPPPPPIPLAQFQALPKAHTQHKSPTRVLQPLRQGMPAQQHHGALRHTTMMPHHHHHHHPGHTHAGAHRHGHAHARGHGHPANVAAWQQQAHRGRPR